MGTLLMEPNCQDSGLRQMPWVATSSSNPRFKIPYRLSRLPSQVADRPGPEPTRRY